MPRCSPDGVGPRHTTDERRHHHVLEGRELRKEMVELEHEADAFVPEPRDPVVTHGIEVRAAVEHFATRGPLQASQDMEQGALADARGADDGEHLTLPDIQVDPVEHVERLRAAHERLAELLNLNESGFYFFSPFLSDSFSFSTVFSMVEAFSCISSLISSACFPAPTSFLPAVLSSCPPPKRTNTTMTRATKTRVRMNLFALPFCAMGASFRIRDKIQSAKLRCYSYLSTSTGSCFAAWSDG